MYGPDDLTGPVNLRNPGELTMIELAEAVKDRTGSRSVLVHAPLPQDDPKQRQPDISLAREQLGWEPGVGLREGLRPTIADFEALLRRVRFVSDADRNRRWRVNDCRGVLPNNARVNGLGSANVGSRFETVQVFRVYSVWARNALSGLGILFIFQIFN